MWWSKLHHSKKPKFILYHSDYSAKKQGQNTHDYPKTAKKTSRRIASPWTEVVNIYRSGSRESKDANLQSFDLSAVLNKNSDLNFQNIQMFYAQKDSSNSYIDLDNDRADKSLTKIEKITKQKIKDLKVM